MQFSNQRHDDDGEDEKDEQERRRQSAYQNETFGTKCSKKNSSMAAQIPRRPTVAPCPRPEPAAETPPPRSPTPALATAAPSPALGPAIRRGAARRGGERGGPVEARIRGRPPLGNRPGANRGALRHRRRFGPKGCGFRWCGHRPPRVEQAAGMAAADSLRV